jgi:hypothetical protein
MSVRTLVALSALALLPAVASPAHAKRSFSFTGDDVAVWNPAGQVQIEAGSGGAVEVSVDLQGRDADDLRLDDQPIGGRPTLRVLYPGNTAVYPEMGRWSNTNANMKSDGTWGAGRHSVNLFGRRFTVHGGGSGTEAWTDLVVRVPKGRKVSVHTLAGGAEIRNVDGQLSYDGGSGAVLVETSRGSLVLDLGSGGVEVNGFAGDLDVDTGSGSVKVHEVRGARVHLDTGSGGVTGDRVLADELMVDTGSGSVDLTDVETKRAKLDTGSGGVSLGLLSATPDLDIDTGSGSVHVWVPQDFSARLHLETGSGGIHSDLPVTIEEKDSGTLRGTIGSGEGRVHVDTGSGGVTLLAAVSGRARNR